MNYMNQNLIYACALNNKTLLKSTDFGVSWIQINLDKCDTLKRIFFLNENLGWAETYFNDNDTYIQRTTDGGKNWEIVKEWTNFNSFFDVDMFFINDSIGYGPSYSGYYKITDGGKNWNFITAKEFRNITYFTHENTNYFWAVGWDGLIIKSSPDDSIWSQVAGYFIPRYNQDRVEFNSLYFSDKDNGFIITTDNLYKTTDAGKSWVLHVKYQNHPSLSGISFLQDKTNGWIWGANNTLIRTTNNGNDWTNLNLVNNGNLRKVFFLDINQGWLVGYGSPIRKTTDGGLNWLEPAGGLLYWLSDIFFIDKLTGWAVGSATKTELLKTTDGGTSWNDITKNLKEHLNKIFFFDENKGILLGETILHKTTDGGLTWNIIFDNNEDIIDFHFIDKQNGWILVTDSKFQSVLYSTKDAGTTWKQYPEKFNNINIIHL